ncbi:MAG: hypothetical protein RL685_5182 [Pseudomonadota bacterium]
MSDARAEIRSSDVRLKPAGQPLFYVLCALCVLLLVPGLLVGPVFDDWFHSYDAHAAQGWWKRLFGLYEFFDAEQVSEARAHGLLPWWSDDALTISFLRPLSSLLLAMNHLLLDGGGLLSHLHALLWYAAVLLAAHRVLVLLFGATVARWSTLLYALSAVHLMPLAFVAALHSHVSTLFTLLSLECLIRAQRSGAQRLQLWSLLWYLLAFAGGESAIVLVPIAGALLWAEQGPRPALRLLAPHLAITLLIAVAYVALGYGSHHSGAYLQPGSAAFFRELVPRWLVLNGGLWTSFPPDLWLFGAAPVQMIAGVLGLALAALALRSVLRELEPSVARRLTALLLGSLLSLALMTSGIPGGRLLLLPALIAAVLFALAARRAARAWAGGHRARALLLGAWVVVFGVGLNPLFRALIPRDMARVSGVLPDMARSVAEHCRGATGLAVGVADSNAAYLSGLFQQLPEAERPQVFHLISMAPGKHRLSQLSEAQFQLDIEGDFLDFPWARIYRDSPIPVPFRQSLPGVEVEVLEANERGARLALHTPRDLARCWITVEKGQFIPLQPSLSTPLEWTPTRAGP